MPDPELGRGCHVGKRVFVEEGLVGQLKEGVLRVEQVRSDFDPR